MMWTWLCRSVASARGTVHQRFGTFEGRLDRGTFIARYVVLYLIVFVPAVAGVASVLDSATRNSAAALISGAAALALLTGSLPLLVRRFHDFGLSGQEVAVYYFLGGMIGAVRTIAMKAETDHVSATLAQGEISTWLLVWYVPGVLWAMAPFLIPGDRGVNRYGPSAARPLVSKRVVRRRRMGADAGAPLPAPTRVAF